MKKLILFSTCVVIFYCTYGQYSVEYHPSIQSDSNMQYWKPKGNLNVGDCMPFFNNNTFSVYWLVDSLHGNNLNGLGGHQWVLSTSKDLIHWKQDSIVIGIDHAWEKSICTGSVVYYKNRYYAFYATRLINNNKVNEQLSYAISDDGIHFIKQMPNPFYKSAPGYSQRNFRDPKVFVDSAGEFHLFVASQQDNPVIAGASGCLVHLTSRDLKHWMVHKPILTGQDAVPECPDYFYWRRWYYLVYNDNSNTFYVKSKNPYGPWEQPRYQSLDEDWVNVAKTAGFSNGRRIAVGWIPARFENKDNGHEIFGGNTIFREITQEPDGTLDTKFVPEMIPETGQRLTLKLMPDLSSRILNNNSCIINSPNGIGASHLEKVPKDCRITLEIDPIGRNEEYGLYLRSDKKAIGGYKLNISAINQTVSLGNTTIHAVGGLNHDIKVDIIMKDDMIDVCINNKRCIVNRTPEQKGHFLWLYAKHGEVEFTSIKISPLIKDNK